MQMTTLLLCILRNIIILSGIEIERPQVDLIQQIFSHKDICSTLIGYINTHESLDDIIALSKAMHQTNKFLNKQIGTAYAYGDQKKFIELVQMLSKRFNKSTEAIAQQFKTKTSYQYVAAYVYLALMKDLSSSFFEDIDPNYTSDTPENLPPLFLTIKYRSGRRTNWGKRLEHVKLLIKRGANVHYKHSKHGTIVDYTTSILSSKCCSGPYQKKDMADLLWFIIDAFCGSDTEKKQALYTKHDWVQLEEGELQWMARNAKK